MRRAGLIFGIVLCLASAAAAAEREFRHLVVVSGIGGEPFYSELFHRWAMTFLDLARDHLQLDTSHVFYLAEDPARAPDRTAGRSSREQVARTLRDVAERSMPEDLVMVLLIGHGTARGDRVLFNLPGPDLSAAELSALLEPLAGRRVVVVNATSASGPFVGALSAPGRIVITATADAAENQHPRFGGHFVSAFAAPDADRDKDRRVSLLEAFSFSTGQVALDYERDKRLRTEHALLDDDGDGVGDRAPGGDAADGRLAARTFLTGTADTIPDSTRAMALVTAARALVERIELLKRRKRELSETAYEAELESLLVELALNRRALRSGWAP